MSIVYLNGSVLPKSDAFVSVDDRGFLFGDGIYEVTSAYSGHLFLMERHLARMRTGLSEIRIDFDVAVVPDLLDRLLSENALTEGDAYVYVQVTRGVAPRAHAFPKSLVPPTVYAFATAFQRPGREEWEKGFAAVTVPDLRWARVDIKTIALLPNCLAQQAAVEAGVPDALLVRDGIAIEGSHNNFFAVFDGTVVTHPANNSILAGIIREYVLELCRDLGVPVELRPIMAEELSGAEEAFFTGTTTELRPTVRIDGERVGAGTVGPVVRSLYEAFLAGIELAGVEGS